MPKPDMPEIVRPHSIRPDGVDDHAFIRLLKRIDAEYGGGVLVRGAGPKRPCYFVNMRALRAACDKWKTERDADAVSVSSDVEGLKDSLGALRRRVARIEKQLGIAL